MIIITHGRIVNEAIKVTNSLADSNVRVGIVLLEVLKPYQESAKNILQFIGKNVKAVLFYEEEIKSGGMGMNLSEALSNEFISRNIKYDILAIDDNFATASVEGRSYICRKSNTTHYE